MQDISFYQAHLDRVSRSFAFCIPKLAPNMRLWTSLSYLLCRVLDTVEDSDWKEHAVQEQHYIAFDSFVKKPPDLETMKYWLSHFPGNLSEGESLLLKDAALLLEDLHQLPWKIQQIIQTSVLRMSTGMRYYSARRFRHGVIGMLDMTDVNRYCYFVAGVVGELLSKLLLESRLDFKPDPNFMKNAFHFGLFLQKINLLKDQHMDEQKYRYFVPDRQQVLESLRDNAIGSLNYLTSLPADETGYRTFCGWSLFLGLASLSWIQQDYHTGDGSKIPRLVTEELLKEVEQTVHDNEKLRTSLNEYLATLPKIAKQSRTAKLAETDWFFSLSGSLLMESELLELRLL